ADVERNQRDIAAELEGGIGSVPASSLRIRNQDNTFWTADLFFTEQRFSAAQRLLVIGSLPANLYAPDCGERLALIRGKATDDLVALSESYQRQAFITPRFIAGCFGAMLRGNKQLVAAHAQRVIEQDDSGARPAGALRTATAAKKWSGESEH